MGGGSFSVGSTTFDRLLFDVLRVELAVSFCSMRPEWFEVVIMYMCLCSCASLGEPCAGVVSYCRQDIVTFVSCRHISQKGSVY